MSLRRRINQNCKSCVYDPSAAGTWRQQISNAGTGPSASSGAFKALTDATILQYTHSDGTAYQFIGETGVIPQDIPSLNYYYFDIGANVAATLTNLASEINTVIGAGTATSHSSGGTGTLGLTGSATTTATNITFKSGSTTSTGVGAVAIAFSGPGAVTGVLTSGSTFSSNDVSFQLRTHTDGAIMNSRPGNSNTNLDVASNDVFVSTSVAGAGTKTGTRNNLRWEITNVNEKKGTFTVLIRRGDDSSKRKVILETWNNCSLDPNENNYIGAVIGTQRTTIGDSTSASPYLQPNGNFKNRSQFVYVDESTIKNTVDYLTENGDIRDTSLTGSLPMNNSSGSFAGGSDGTNFIVDSPFGSATAGAANYYENINADNFQGLDVANSAQTGYIAYNCAFNLLSNQDEFDINLLIAPGLSYEMSAGLTNKMVTVCEERGDVMIGELSGLFDNKKNLN